MDIDSLIELFVMAGLLVGLTAFALWPFRSILDGGWAVRHSQLLAYQERLIEQGSPEVFAPNQVPAIDFRGSVVAQLGWGRECRGWFELSEDGIHGVATDLKFRFKLGKHSPVWTQTILQIKFPGEELPLFVAHPRKYSRLAAYERVQVGSALDLTHQFECLFPDQIQAMFANAGCVQDELDMLNTRPWSIECDRDRILIYQLRHLVPPAVLQPFIRDGVHLAKAILTLSSRLSTRLDRVHSAST